MYEHRAHVWVTTARQQRNAYTICCAYARVFSHNFILNLPTPPDHSSSPRARVRVCERSMFAIALGDGLNASIQSFTNIKCSTLLRCKLLLLFIRLNRSRSLRNLFLFFSEKDYPLTASLTTGGLCFEAQAKPLCNHLCIRQSTVAIGQPLRRTRHQKWRMIEVTRFNGELAAIEIAAPPMFCLIYLLMFAQNADITIFTATESRRFPWQFGRRQRLNGTPARIRRSSGRNPIKIKRKSHNNNKLCALNNKFPQCPTQNGAGTANWLRL